MPAPNKVLSVITGQAVTGNAGIAIMARIRGSDGNLITQASLLAIAYSVYDIDAAASLVSSTALTISSVVYDSLQQTDQIWTKDALGRPGTDQEHGYNFKAILPASSVPVASSGNRIQIDVAFTPTSGEQFRLTYKVDTVKVYA